MPPEEAMQEYVAIVQRRERVKIIVLHRVPMGPVFSTFVYEEESGNELKLDAIHVFAREGDVENLLKCIESSVSLNQKDSEGWTPLHWAVNRGHLSITELLASRNADINAKDNDGQTPLSLTGLGCNLWPAILTAD